MQPIHLSIDKMEEYGCGVGHVPYNASYIWKELQRNMADLIAYTARFHRVSIDNRTR